VGIGVLKAAQDAAALARSLDECASVPLALECYQRERLQPNINAVEFGRYLGSFIESGLAGPTSDTALNLSYELIIRKSARLQRVSRRIALVHQGKGAAMNIRSTDLASTIPFDIKKLDDLL
jgi:2-polyprenyl-6-methoxyphenol hydroxylase-like FAD-dependent oxidoreductase